MRYKHPAKVKVEDITSTDLQLVTGYKFTAQGSTVKTVVCESCEEVFLYLMERQVSKQVSEVPFRPSAIADKIANAQDDVDNLLQKSLSGDCDFVPCPNCGSYQEQMVKKHKKEIVVGGFGLTFIVIVICAITLGVLKVSLLYLLLVLAVGVMITIVYRVLSNPNSNTTKNLQKSQKFLSDNKMITQRQLNSDYSRLLVASLIYLDSTTVRPQDNNNSLKKVNTFLRYQGFDDIAAKFNVINTAIYLSNNDLKILWGKIHRFLMEPLKLEFITILLSFTEQNNISIEHKQFLNDMAKDCGITIEI